MVNNIIVNKIKIIYCKFCRLCLYYLTPFPMASLTLLYPSFFNSSANSIFIFEMTGGPWYMRAVYICTALAPANIFSYASCPVNTPPTPIIGIAPEKHCL